jgi:hypothetical protein
MLKMVPLPPNKIGHTYQVCRHMSLGSHSAQKSLPSIVDETTFGLATQIHICVSIPPCVAFVATHVLLVRHKERMLILILGFLFQVFNQRD